ncbi:hypothetical protein JMN32_03640 [Fulvivirga sp. 29W222]|uniref:Uncharacterized protein n=1 Tax=Fulvivirga marina TaxID=2494733 RepID=A0A937KB34_9BACT|nr:hypothetical protein [Fulvivirga marina]MBL6445384.1 hypothetical protein [Fulvivirga marina]
MVKIEKVQTTVTQRFSAVVIQEAWDKGHVVPGLNKDSWREDDNGNLLKRADYGNSSSNYGWKVSARSRPLALADCLVMLTVRLNVA